MATSGEDDLIARYFRPLAKAAGSFALSDDAAVLPEGATDLVLTTDAIVEGVHFLPEDPPDMLARKALRVNLSDLAAKGASPAGFLLTLALRRVDAAWLAGFAKALGEDAEQFGCPLLGGDTVSTPGPLMISITALGRVSSGTMVRRAGAQPGDVVVVSGTIGDAVLGLDILKGRVPAQQLGPDLAAHAINRYRIPQPRTTLAAAIAADASAAMDVSDGLAGDLAKLCAVSGVSAAINLADIPLSDATRVALSKGLIDLETLVSGGDDYEILCTVSEVNWPRLHDSAKAARIAVMAIGRIIAGREPPTFRDDKGRAVSLGRTSYSHF